MALPQLPFDLVQRQVLATQPRWPGPNTAPCLTGLRIVVLRPIVGSPAGTILRWETKLMRLDTKLVDDPLHLSDVFLAVTAACCVDFELYCVQRVKQLFQGGRLGCRLRRQPAIVTHDTAWLVVGLSGVMTSVPTRYHRCEALAIVAQDRSVLVPDLVAGGVFMNKQSMPSGFS